MSGAKRFSNFHLFVFTLSVRPAPSLCHLRQSFGLSLGDRTGMRELCPDRRSKASPLYRLLSPSFFGAWLSTSGALHDADRAIRKRDDFSRLSQIPWASTS